MPWKRVRFKGNKVFAQVDEQGVLLEAGGRTSIRYKLTDERTYPASARALSPLSAEEGGEVMHPDPPEVSSPPLEPSSPEPSAEALVRRKESPEGARRARKAIVSEPISAPLEAEIALTGGKPPILVYTDGACSVNPGPAGLGVVLKSGELRKEHSEFLGEATNNIAELTAILRALELIKDRSRLVLIHTDSEYSIGVLTGTWKVKANQELVDEIVRLIRTFKALRFVKVPAHAGIPENERCDTLAREAILRATGVMPPR